MHQSRHKIWRLLQFLLCFVLLPTWRISDAENLPVSPIFSYEGNNLHLLLYSPEHEKTDIEVTPVDDAGRPMNRTLRKQIDLQQGENILNFAVKGDENGHRIFFEVSGIEYEIWANRGIWFSLPKKMFVAESNIPARNTGLSRPSDIQLAKGFGIQVKYKPEPGNRLAAVRTLGYPSSYGIKFNSSDYAFLLIASGTIGSAKLTLAQRIDGNILEYWDYYLTLEPHSRRYVIPFSRFAPREKNPKPLRSINSITLESLHPADTGSQMRMSFVGLSRPGPKIGTIEPSQRGYAVQLHGPIWQGAKIGYSDAKGKRYFKPINQNTVQLSREARKIWFCYEDSPPQVFSGKSRGILGRVATVCDPADAPHTSYQAPSSGKDSFVLDDFSSVTHVNAHRLPQVVFGSTTSIEQAMKYYHRKGSLQVTYFPKSANDYGGYITYFPPMTPPHLTALELRLRGPIPTDSVYIGLRDGNDVEVKVLLQDYLRGERPPNCSDIGAAPSGEMNSKPTSAAGAYCAESSSSYLGLSQDREIVGVEYRTVKIPLAAFRAIRKNLQGKDYPRYKQKSVSVVMVYAGPDVTHQLELASIRLLDEAPPLVLCRFDAKKETTNSLQGGIYTESAHGTQFATSFDGEGFHGKGLKVQVSSTRPEGYGLVGIILGMVDASPYRSLFFRVRGENGGENAAIHLSDGKKKAIVHLRDYVQARTDWTQVKIPLTAFSKQNVDISNINQLVLVWENQVNTQETIYFDDFELR